MSGQNALITICSDAQSLEPESTSHFQLYFDNVKNILSGKVKGGNIGPISILIPDSKGTTTNSTPTEIAANSIFRPLQERIKIPLNNSFFYSYFVMATRTGGSAPGTIGSSGIAQLQFLVKNLGGVTSIVVTNGPVFLNTGDAEASAWIANVTNIDNELVFTVTGEANKTIVWDARILILANVDFTTQ